MRASMHLNSVFEIISDELIKGSNAKDFTIWTLHSLYVIIESSGIKWRLQYFIIDCLIGPAFSSLANATLAVLQSVILRNGDEELLTRSFQCEQYQCIGKIINTIFHSLGPELTANADNMLICRSVVGILKVIIAFICRILSIIE
jgi:hypothetical protein